MDEGKRTEVLQHLLGWLKNDGYWEQHAAVSSLMAQADRTRKSLETLRGKLKALDSRHKGPILRLWERELDLILEELGKP